MKKVSVILFTLVLGIFLIHISCSSTKKNATGSDSGDKQGGSVSVPGPPAIVYKTKKDYYKHVPVTLSEDKSKIIAFPAQSDLKVNGKYTYPTRLSSGYLLDNRGVGKNTAFLRFTYDDYYTMDNIPTPERLMNYIIDDDPFTELYDCGRKSDYDNPVEMLNRKIESGDISGCRNLLK